MEAYEKQCNENPLDMYLIIEVLIIFNHNFILTLFACILIASFILCICVNICIYAWVSYLSSIIY